MNKKGIVHDFCVECDKALFSTLETNVTSGKQGKISISDIKNIAKELGVHFTDAEIHAMVGKAYRDEAWSTFAQ
nr:probable calcium-binding protein CML20 [Tanacetum cinerariifolium]